MIFLSVRGMENCKMSGSNQGKVKNFEVDDKWQPWILSKNGTTLKRISFHMSGSKFFPLRVDSCWGGGPPVALLVSLDRCADLVGMALIPIRDWNLVNQKWISLAQSLVLSPLLILIRLKYCWKGCKISSHSAMLLWREAKMKMAELFSAPDKKG